LGGGGEPGSHKQAEGLYAPVRDLPFCDLVQHLVRIRSTSCSTTTSSASMSGRGSGGGEAMPAFCSTSFIMSNSILVIRKSALAGLLTIWVTIASRLATLRPRPSIVT
jgi:hypothetical protein